MSNEKSNEQLDGVDKNSAPNEPTNTGETETQSETETSEDTTTPESVNSSAETETSVETENSAKTEAAAAVTADSTHEQGTESSAGTSTAEAEEKSGNEFLEKVTAIAKGYWTFFLENLKAPASRAFDNTQKDFIYGYINFFVLSLFLAFGLYFQIRSATSFGGFGPVIGFSDVFFSVFFYALVSFVIGVAIVFGVLKLLMKGEVSFHDVVGRFGAMISIPVALSVLYFIISITGISMLTNFLALLVMSGIQIGVILTLYSHRKTGEGAFDPIYALFITYAVYVIYLGVSAQMILESIISSFLMF
ncbi:hypothetical protein [Evansella tamaricis]|uniref:Uncharacterized protein n=1 Tax=Evansella tamaricis TaxID=2069301 RepID=A0ABS6JJW8_9BACI|nr:hypothetical protein [Evansella tamaricis]MBU9713965.1 hypothetical protein [Evansella tamaricis]